MERVENHTRAGIGRAVLHGAVNTPAISFIFFVLLIVYLYHFIESLPYWFHPGWTTDDALQQWFPFHELLNPGVFQGDFIYETMRGYLAPAHYGFCALVTWLTGDVLMAAHWVMLIQVLLAATFLFAVVRRCASTPAALFSVIWFLHCRYLIQRMTGGLPRGWAAVLIPAICYFALRKNHTAILIILFLGCLSNPPTTFVCGVAYGLWLFVSLFVGGQREMSKPFWRLVVLVPVYAAVTFFVVQRPEDVGQMVSLAEAVDMPQFQVPDGRFAFLPFPTIPAEILTFGFLPFLGRLYNPGPFVEYYMPALVLLLFVGMIACEVARKRSSLPGIFYAFLVSILIVYLLSRPLAFWLYVPNRHLQFPLGLFWIMTFPILVWRVFDSRQREATDEIHSPTNSWRGALGLFVLAGFIILGSGSGLQGSANFNYSYTKHGKLFLWAKEYTSRDSLFAGEPRLIDGMMLLGERRAYATNETYHPFYSRYRQEIERRLEVSFRAHYAQSLQEVYDLLYPEGIDYFVFRRKRFYPEELKKESFHPPLGALVRSLTALEPERYAYKQLPSKVDTGSFPPLVFRDDFSAIVDIHALGVWLQGDTGDVS